jgi:hypothetical protein
MPAGALLRSNPASQQLRSLARERGIACLLGGSVLEIGSRGGSVADFFDSKFSGEGVLIPASQIGFRAGWRFCWAHYTLFFQAWRPVTKYSRLKRSAECSASTERPFTG